MQLMSKKESDRVISFSVKPADVEGFAEITKLKEHCRKTGISFSYFMLLATKRLNKELKLK